LTEKGVVTGPARRFLPLVLALLALAVPALWPGQATAARQVLVLNSYHPGYKWSDDLLHALETALRRDDPETVIRVEHLDTKLNTDPAYLDTVPDCLSRKYAVFRPDLIVASDDSAFNLMLRHGESIFGDVPTVFCGVNAGTLPPLPPWMTGVREYVDMLSTLKLMRNLQPDMREIVVIADRTTTSRSALQNLLAIVPGDLRVRVLDDLPLKDLEREVAALGPGTGLLFLIYFRDREGRGYEYGEVLSALSRVSPVPIFGAWNFLMGHGLFGGFLTSGYAQGRIAGEMGLRILAGEKPADIPVTMDNVVNLEIDVQQMERFGISPVHLPKEAHFFNAGAGSRRDVLILHSYNSGFKWTDDIMRGMAESLDARASDTELHVEWMDTKRHPESEFNFLTYRLLGEKYRFTDFSVVLTSDDNAFNFARQNRKVLFGDAPIVFCGVNYLENPEDMAAENITGVLESYDIAATVQAAARLVPAARRLYVINDASPTGLGNLRRFEEVRELLPQHLQVEMLQNMSMTRLLQRLPDLPPDSVVLLMSMNRDRDGNIFTYAESCEMIVSACPVPVFSFWDFYLGSGTVGGMVTSGYHQGLTAGAMARDILEGGHARDHAVVTRSPNAFMFDAAVLDRFGLDRGRLPQGAILINNEDDSTKYRRAMRIVFALTGLIVALLVFFALIYRRQRRKRQLLEERARMDMLTGACTRDAFERDAAKLIDSSTERKERFMLCYLDVDRLKDVNDTHGHHHGDAYLQAVVAALRSSMRSSDEIYRIGGDEFVLVFPGCGPDEVGRIWDKAQERIDALNSEGTHPFPLSFTYGCAPFDPESPTDLDSLMREADQSMYRRKNGNVRHRG
jgi:diguanylate cyclase (GGDEF)-like protein